MRITIELGYLSDEQLADLQRLLLESTWMTNAYLRALGAILVEQHLRAQNLILMRDLVLRGVPNEDTLGRDLARTRVPE